MITAKTAKNNTKVERYIKDKCEEIEEQIKMCAEVGLSYCSYNNKLPVSIQNMLKELGYRVDKHEDMFVGTRYIISWGEAKEDDIECN